MRGYNERNDHHDTRPYRQPCCEQKHLLQLFLPEASRNSYCFLLSTFLYKRVKILSYTQSTKRLKGLHQQTSLSNNVDILPLRFYKNDYLYTQDPHKQTASLPDKYHRNHMLDNLSIYILVRPSSLDTDENFPTPHQNSS